MTTLEKAIKLLEKEYERAKGLEYVHNPLAYALFRVWKIVDKEKALKANTPTDTPTDTPTGKDINVRSKGVE